MTEQHIKTEQLVEACISRNIYRTAISKPGSTFFCPDLDETLNENVVLADILNSLNASHITSTERQILLEALRNELPIVYGKRFAPTHEKLVTFQNRKFVNSHIPFDYRPELAEPDLPKIVHAYFERIAPDLEQRNALLDYLAHSVQKPTERPSFALVLYGAGGTGKSSLFKMMNQISGDNRSRVFNLTKVSDLFAEHTDCLHKRAFVVLDDLKIHIGIAESLKNTITQDTCRIDPKGEAEYSAKCYARIAIIFNSDSNHRLHLTDSPEFKRRFFVLNEIKHPFDPCESSDFFRELNSVISNNQFAHTLYHYLKHRDISQFNPFSPPEAAFFSLCGQSCESADALLSKLNAPHPFQLTDATAAAREIGLKADETYISDLLKSAGYKSHQISSGKLKGKRRWWKAETPPHEIARLADESLTF